MNNTIPDSFSIEQGIQLILARQTEQAERQTEQYNQLTARLDRIEKNTIIIRDRVLSQFEGISPQTKSEIETLACDAMDNKGEILAEAEVFNPQNPQYKTPEFKAKRREIREYKLSDTINSYNSPVDGGTFYVSNSGREIPERGYISACGNWVSSVVSQMLGTNLKGYYPTPIRPLVDSLVGFWVCERSESGRLF